MLTLPMSHKRTDLEGNLAFFAGPLGGRGLASRTWLIGRDTTDHLDRQTVQRAVSTAPQP